MIGTAFLAVPEQQAVTIGTTDRVSIVNTSTPSRGLANLAFADGGGKDVVSERRVLMVTAVVGRASGFSLAKSL